MNNLYRGGKEEEKKPIITIWATERGKLHQNKYDFSFGTGKSDYTGYPMMCNGRILKIALSVDTKKSYDIAVPINGEEKGKIKKDSITPEELGNFFYPYEWKIFDAPIELKIGDTINFLVKKEVNGCQCTLMGVNVL